MKKITSVVLSVFLLLVFSIRIDAAETKYKFSNITIDTIDKLTESLEAKTEGSENKFAFDTTGTIDEKILSSLISYNVILDEFYENKPEVALYVAENYEGSSIKNYSKEIFNQYKFGKEGHNNGILITIALDDREFFVTYGDGITDEMKNFDSDDVVDNGALKYLKSLDYNLAIPIMVNNVFNEMARVLPGDDVEIINDFIKAETGTSVIMESYTVYTEEEIAQQEEQKQKERLEAKGKAKLTFAAILGGGALIAVVGGVYNYFKEKKEEKIRKEEDRLRAIEKENRRLDAERKKRRAQAIARELEELTKEINYEPTKAELVSMSEDSVIGVQGFIDYLGSPYFENRLIQDVMTAIQHDIDYADYKAVFEKYTSMLTTRVQNLYDRLNDVIQPSGMIQISLEYPNLPSVEVDESSLALRLGVLSLLSLSPEEIDKGIDNYFDLPYHLREIGKQKVSQYVETQYKQDLQKEDREYYQSLNPTEQRRYYDDYIWRYYLYGSIQRSMIFNSHRNDADRRHREHMRREQERQEAERREEERRERERKERQERERRQEEASRRARSNSSNWGGGGFGGGGGFSSGGGTGGGW